MNVTEKMLGAEFDVGTLVRIAADDIAGWDASDWDRKYDLGKTLNVVGTVLKQTHDMRLAFTLVHCPSLTPSVFWTHTMMLVPL